MPSVPAVGSKRIMFSACLLPVNICFMWYDICVPSGGISMKLATNSHHVSGHCWKGFQGQRSRLRWDEMHFCSVGIHLVVSWLTCILFVICILYVVQSRILC